MLSLVDIFRGILQDQIRTVILRLILALVLIQVFIIPYLQISPAYRSLFTFFQTTIINYGRAFWIEVETNTDDKKALVGPVGIVAKI
jgi:hypothetical protein